MIIVQVERKAKIQGSQTSSTLLDEPLKGLAAAAVVDQQGPARSSTVSATARQARSSSASKPARQPANVSDAGPSPVPSQARSCSHLSLPHRRHSHPRLWSPERMPQSDSLSRGNAPAGPASPSPASELDPEPAESTVAAELTRAKDLRRGKNWSQRKDMGRTPVRWSDVTPDRAGQAARSAAGDTAEPGRRRSVESRDAAGAAATASSRASASRTGVAAAETTVRAERKG
ncbi:hypothetical protein U9M48_010869 [Paspalum notatum var. saurae]|uniref:Uncharacterized protein n=1 Tax=Paspalum notatum var. saurae TaxID=547442 RepID=A0AAQ3WGP9_PASNO